MGKQQGRKAFGITPEFAAATKVLSGTQGLYKRFLVASLLWGLWLGAAGSDVKTFFLACVVVAGMYGAAKVSRRILVVKAVPAALRWVALW